MVPSKKASCYVVELSVSPGGSRWAELHAYATAPSLRTVIRKFCRNGQGLSTYHAIWYGAILGVWIVQRGEIVDFIDLHPLITVTLGASKTTLADRDACFAILGARRRAMAEDPGEVDEDDIDEDALAALEEMRLDLEWPALEALLPSLEAPLLRAGERAKRRRRPGLSGPRRSYVDLEEAIRFGSYDVESGKHLDGPEERSALPSEDDDE